MTCGPAVSDPVTTVVGRAEARPRLDLLDLSDTVTQRLRQYAVTLKMQATWFFRQS